MKTRFLYTVAFVALAFITCCAFTACGSTPPKNANQWGSQILTDYDDAKETGAVYGELPTCTATSPKICSKASLVVSIKVAKDTAKPVIDQAIAALRDPAITTGDQAAIIAGAEHALLALTSLTNQIALLVNRKVIPARSS